MSVSARNAALAFRGPQLQWRVLRHEDCVAVTLNKKASPCECCRNQLKKFKAPTKRKHNQNQLTDYVITLRTPSYLYYLYLRVTLDLKP